MVKVLRVYMLVELNVERKNTSEKSKTYRMVSSAIMHTSYGFLFSSLKSFILCRRLTVARNDRRKNLFVVFLLRSSYNLFVICWEFRLFRFFSSWIVQLSLVTKLVKILLTLLKFQSKAISRKNQWKIQKWNSKSIKSECILRGTKFYRLSVFGRR